MIHIVNFSFGEMSYAAAKRVVTEYGVSNTKLLFADVKDEDEDTYLWGYAAAKKIGAELIVIADGRTPWEVFRDERFLGNSRADPCSKILKRELCDRWLKNNFEPAEVTCYFGYHISEEDRFERWDSVKEEWAGTKPRMAAAGWTARAPLCEKPWKSPEQLRAEMLADGLWIQKMYRLGFPHANCGGRCAKQGQTGWALLLKTMPERFAEVEAKEQAMQEFLGKPVTMLQESRAGVKRGLSLKVLRERIEEGEQMPLYDFGACSCFAGADQ